METAETERNKARKGSKFFSMLSLCKKAGMLVSGESKAEIAIKARNAKIVLLSCDASKNTRKKFVNSSNYYKIPLYTLEADKEVLGGSIGDGIRSVVAVIDSGFAKRLEALLSAEEKAE